MRRLRTRPLLFLFLLGCLGCSTSPPGGDGGSPSAPPTAPGAPPASATTGWPSEGRRVVLVGFDSNEPLVKALRTGKIQGLVLQNPHMMGERGVKTMVAVLEKQKVEPVIDTGEAIATPENLD